jgi:tRNA A37 threonylcarbamoyladenosine biosynthesis protein TsaE
MRLEITTKSYEETEVLGHKLAQNFRGGEVVMLSSDLGGGKTTFTRGIAAGLGSVDDVSSPTFTVSQIYEGGKFRLLHIDMYRLSGLERHPDSVPAFAVSDLSTPSSDILLLEDDGIGESDTVTVIEWATEGMISQHTNSVKIAINKLPESDEHRQFIIEVDKSLEYLLKVVKGSYNDLHEYNTRHKS